MATTISLTGRLADIMSRPIDSISNVTVKAPSYRPGPGVELTTSQPTNVELGGDGEITIDVVEGIGWIYVEGDGWSDSIRFVAAEGMTTLWEAVVNALPIILEAKRLLWNLGELYEENRSDFLSLANQFTEDLSDLATKRLADLNKAFNQNKASLDAAGANYVDSMEDLKNQVLSYVFSQTDGEDATILGVLSNPNSQANAWLESALATRPEIEALDARTAPQKMLLGLPVPKPNRAPSMAIVAVVPDSQIDAQVVLAEGNTLWAYGRDRSLYKSDGGGVWEHLSYQPNGLQYRGGLTRCPDGSLLMFSTIFTMRRSTDEGKTWTDVLPRRSTGAQPLTTQSMAVNPTTGHVFYGEYIVGDSGGKAVLWRSTDNGVTWSEHFSWPTVDGQPNRITHIHGVQYDPIGDDVYIMTGDGSPATGFWKVSGNTCVPVLTNADLVGVSDSVGSFHDAPRAIGAMFFRDYIAWGSDSTSSPHIFRIPRSAFGVDATKIERGPRMSSTSWGTARASVDGSRWVMFSSDEAFPTHAADRLAHIYAVEDQGATVYEVGAVASQAATNYAATLQPAGLAENFGEYFWFNMRTGAAQNGAWKARLGYGGQTIPWPSQKPTPIIQSQSSGVITVPGNSAITFGRARVPAFARRFAIYDATFTLNEGDWGHVGIRVKTEDGTVVYISSTASARQAKRAEHGGPIYIDTFPASATLIFEVFNYRANQAVASGTLTYAVLA